MTTKELKAEIEVLKAEVADLRWKLLVHECNRPIQYIPYPQPYNPYWNPYPYWPTIITCGTGNTIGIPNTHVTSAAAGNY